MTGKIKILSSGDSAIYCIIDEAVSPEINRMVYALEEFLVNLSLPGFIETVPSYNGLMVYYNPLVIEKDTICNHIDSFNAEVSGYVNYSDQPAIIIPLFYGKEYGPDIGFVASNNNLSADEVISIHSSVKYRIYMLGFTPGFPYLGGMDRRISTPRKQEPRLRIPAGSIGIAGEQTGIYPIESPGGWQIIGRTPLRLYDPAAESPFLLKPGQYLRFRPVEFDEYVEIHRSVSRGEYIPEIINS